MATLIDEFKVCANIPQNVKHEIKLFHIHGSVFYVTNDGNVFAFGVNTKGCLGLGHNNAVTKPQLIPELSHINISEFSFGYYSTIALTSDNQVYGWGGNSYGQLGRRSENLQFYKPDLISGLNDKNIISISCGYRHCLALSSDGVVYGWGWNRKKQIHYQLETDIFKPANLSSLFGHEISSIYCYFNNSFAITTYGKVYSWGTGWDNRLGRNFSSWPGQLAIDNIIQVGCDRESTYFLSSDGFIYFCGENQIYPKLIDSNIKFNEIQSICWYTSQNPYTALSDNNVYIIRKDSIVRTDYNNFFDYYCNEYEMTYKTTENVKKISDNKEDSSEQKSELSTYRDVDRSDGFSWIALDSLAEAYKFTDRVDKQNEFGKYQLNGFGEYSDRFDELSLIGSGAFGGVYKVKDKFDKHEYAIRKYKFNELNKSIAFNELSLLAEFNSECVVRYNTSWMESNVVYIQMELCSGNLNNILSEKATVFERHVNCPMNSIEYFITSEILREVLECVQYLHERNPQIIHRDLKPHNILVSNRDRNGNFLKIGDFGLATVQYTIPFKVPELGSSKYMSPEVAQGRKYSIKSDIYSLAIIAQELFQLESARPQISSFNCEESLVNNFKALESLISKMMLTPFWQQRPSCAQLLDTYRDWSIDSYSVKNCENYDTISTKLESFENKFFYNYLNAKLKSDECSLSLAPRSKSD